MKRRVLIDTDCGGDDAVAMMCALSSKDIEVSAITTVWGNVNVDQAMENVGKLLDFYGRDDIPLFRGAEGPLMGERETVQWGGFGTDGFGDAAFPPTTRPASASKKHAALAIVEWANSIDVMDESTVYQLITLGPVTNVALALRLYPQLFDHLGSRDIPGVVCMGGAIEGKGNSSLTSEFNIHCDPEAARIVLQHRGLRYPVWLVSWELCVNCAMTWDWYDKWLNRRRLSDGQLSGVGQNRVQIFIEKLFGRLEVFTRPADSGKKADTGDAESTQDITCVIPDAVAVVVAIYGNAFVQDFLETYVTVEVSGRETRGMTCIDWYGTEQSMAKKGRWRNCRVLTKVDVNVFLDAMKLITEFIPN